MTIKTIEKREEWNTLLSSLRSDFSFLQSYEWGEILLADGQTVVRLAVMAGEKLVGVAQVVYKTLYRHYRYALTPKGPVWAVGAPLKESYAVLAAYFQQAGCLFWRLEPEETVPKLAFSCHKTADINPRATLLKDVNGVEEELLASFHPKARYNIRLSERKGLRIETAKDFPVFWRLMQTTGERDGFALHPEHTYRQVLMSDFTRQITAYYGNEAVASGVFAGAGQRLFYVYGASNHAYRELQAPHLIQWEAMKLAKKLGYRYYDFFGIAPGVVGDEGEYRFDTNHPYARVTEFKLRFQGMPTQDVGTYDMVLSLRYYLYRCWRVLRQKCKRR